jgi:hypothetical protein
MPANCPDALSQSMILHHALDIQALQFDDLVFVRQLVAQFM